MYVRVHLQNKLGAKNKVTGAFSETVKTNVFQTLTIRQKLVSKFNRFRVSNTLSVLSSLWGQTKSLFVVKLNAFNTLPVPMLLKFPMVRLVHGEKRKNYKLYAGQKQIKVWSLMQTSKM